MEHLAPQSKDGLFYLYLQNQKAMLIEKLRQDISHIQYDEVLCLNSLLGESLVPSRSLNLIKL